MAGRFDHVGCMVKGRCSGGKGKKKESDSSLYLMLSSSRVPGPADHQQFISLKARQIRQERRNFIQSDFIGEVKTQHNVVDSDSCLFSSPVLPPNEKLLDVHPCMLEDAPS